MTEDEHFDLNCKCLHGIVRFELMWDVDDRPDMYVELYTRYGSNWWGIKQRLVNAWRALRGKTVWIDSIIVDFNELKALSKWAKEKATAMYLAYGLIELEQSQKSEPPEEPPE